MRFLETLRNWRIYVGVICVVLLALILLLSVSNGRLAASNLASYFPFANRQTACVDFPLPETLFNDPEQLTIVLTQFANDRDLTQTTSLKSALHQLYAEDLGTAIVLQTLDCTVLENQNDDENPEKAAANLAAILAAKMGAQIVVWGNVDETSKAITVNFSTAQSAGLTNYSVESRTIAPDLPRDTITGFAARMLTMSNSPNQKATAYQAKRMERVLKLTAQALQDATVVATSYDFGDVWLANGEANLWLNLQSGDNAQLQQAIVSLRAAIRLLKRERERNKWVDAQISLANALMKKSLVAPDVSDVKEAVTAYRLALQGFTPKHSSFDLRAAHSNLGNALMKLAELGGDATAFQNAVLAFDMALKETSRELKPLDWAAAQNDLGIALSALGQQEKGTLRLVEAEQAYRFALEEWKRDLTPMDWATAQNNLGTVLLLMGLRDKGTAKLEEAVSAFRSTLLEWKREQIPLKWATAQNNLGTAHQTIGFRESIKEQSDFHLEEAIAAYRLALTERTKERVPLERASTQNNLAIALHRLAANDANQAQAVTRLKEAADAYQAALEGWTQSRLPLDWAAVQNDLGTVLKALGERTNAPATLMSAVAAYRAALEVRKRETLPLQWATTQLNLAEALKALGERSGDKELAVVQLRQAISAYGAALEAITRKRLPFQWATTQINLGNAFKLLGERSGQSEQAISHFNDAVSAYSNALEEMTPVKSQAWHDLAQRNLNLCLAEIKKLEKL